MSETFQYSIPLPNTSTKSRGEIRRCYDPLRHPELGYNGCQTLYEAFRRGQMINPLGPCLGFRAVSSNGMATPFIYSSYTEVLSRIDAFAAGLDTLNLCLPTDDNLTLIGLYMKNCSEWMIAEQAIFCLSGATVPFYDTLGPETAEYILKQTELKTVVCSRLELERLCKVKKGGTCHNFKYVILVDGVLPDTQAMAQEAGLEVMSFAKVESVGAQRIATAGHKHRPPSGRDIFTFCYTSGTTGNPKGALLTHTNLISAVVGVSGIFDLDIVDRHLSYLPLAHIFERIVACQCYSNGASIGFYRGDPLLLIEDIQACRPTIFPAAPRVLNKIYDKINAGIAAAGGLKKKLFDAACATKIRNLKETGELKHGFYDALLFNKIKKGLGFDHLRILVSGSAPLSAPVMNFFRVMLGVPVIEGYGQTEGAAATTVSLPSDMKTAGHVGCPNAGAEIVLVDVPEMGYLHTDTDHKGQPCQGRGEIWVRGPMVFKGYYKEPEKTRETVDEEGWLHSGDIGLWTASGQLQIIDRKKNIFKLSQGEYVAPEKIENVIIQSLSIAQAFVYGDSLQSALVAIIVPDEDPLRNMLKEAGETSLATANSLVELCQSPKLNALLMKEIQRVGKAGGLYGFELPKAIYLDAEPFSVENGLLTPTFKLKRQQAREKYEAQIESMYQTMPKPKSKL